MNLDGETNLKDRELAVNTIKQNVLTSFSGNISCDPPDESLDKCEGKLQSSDLGRDQPGNIKNLLLRGVTLKNSEYAIGIAIYVGNDTKIMMNSKKPPQKVTNLMLMINKMLYSVFLMQFLVIVAFTTLSMFWQHKNAYDTKYLGLQSKLTFKKVIIQFFTYQVAYSHMIPISLYVMIEMAKLCLAKIINNDVKMFFSEDYGWALCRNTDLIEEMGQVEFVFSDKTGTLT